MSGSIQRAKWFQQWRADGQPDDWRENFVRAGPLSNKVRCRQCGSKGFMGDSFPTSWQIGCLIGHQTCPDCGVPTRNVGAHRRCKLHHACCKDHHMTQHAALVAILESG